jgi:hypothetical protein
LRTFCAKDGTARSLERLATPLSHIAGNLELFEAGGNDKSKTHRQGDDRPRQKPAADVRDGLDCRRPLPRPGALICAGRSGHFAPTVPAM